MPFVSMHGFVIVFVGGFFAVMYTAPMSVFLGSFKAMGTAFKQHDCGQGGLIGLVETMGNMFDPTFLGKGMADTPGMMIMARTAAAGTGTAPAGGDAGGTCSDPAGGGNPGNGQGLIRSELAALKAGMVLQEELAAGDVDIEQKDGSIVVTVGSGGAFSSGSADMTVEAQAIIEKLRKVAGKATKITVTGHTDNVPLSGSTFADNWELASARAASVLREIEASGLAPDAELVAESRGETQPIADNDTPEGREKNRRIEIEIDFNEEGEQP